MIDEDYAIIRSVLPALAVIKSDGTGISCEYMHDRFMVYLVGDKIYVNGKAFNLADPGCTAAVKRYMDECADYMRRLRE